MSTYVKYRASEVLDHFREQILAICARHGAVNPRVVGSVAKGSDTDTSDIDLLVDMPGEYDMWAHASLWGELEELLPIPIDVLVQGILKPAILGDLADMAEAL